MRSSKVWLSLAAVLTVGVMTQTANAQVFVSPAYAAPVVYAPPVPVAYGPQVVYSVGAVPVGYAAPVVYEPVPVYPAPAVVGYPVAPVYAPSTYTTRYRVGPYGNVRVRTRVR